MDSCWQFTLLLLDFCFVLCLHSERFHYKNTRNQTDAAQKLLKEAEHHNGSQIRQNPDGSIIVLPAGTQSILVKSDAILAIASQLRFPFPVRISIVDFG